MAVNQRFSTAVITQVTGNGVLYVVVDLMMMLQMLHVDNQDMYDPVMSIVTATGVVCLNLFCCLQFILYQFVDEFGCIAYACLLYNLIIFTFIHLQITSLIESSSCMVVQTQYLATTSTNCFMCLLGLLQFVQLYLLVQACMVDIVQSCSQLAVR